MTNQEQVEAWHAEFMNAPGKHWGDKINWVTADEIARRLDEAQEVRPMSCKRAPGGYYCTRQAGHDGPCAVVIDEGPDED